MRIECAFFLSPGICACELEINDFYESHSMRLPRKPRSGEMFIEHQSELRSGSSFRSETEYLSPINGLLASSLVPFYKHRIPTGFFRQTTKGGRDKFSAPRPERLG